MKMFALHTMFIDLCNDNFELGGIKLFKTKEEAFDERDNIIEEDMSDYEDIETTDDGYKTQLYLNSDSFYEIQIQEVEI